MTRSFSKDFLLFCETWCSAVCSIFPDPSEHPSVSIIIAHSRLFSKMGVVREMTKGAAIGVHEKCLFIHSRSFNDIKV
jgi:hypothetical protein